MVDPPCRPPANRRCPRWSHRRRRQEQVDLAAESGALAARASVDEAVEPEAREGVGAVVAQLGPVAEDNEAMTDSYAMIDPLGRFYGNHGGRYVFSRPILEVGVAEALAEVKFEVQRLAARGGLYLWRR